MVTLVRGDGSASGPWIIGEWHECAGDDDRMPFHDRVATAGWLSRFEPHDLRRVAHLCGDGAALSGLTDHQIVEQLTGRIVSGAVRVWRPGAKRARTPTAPGVGVGPAAAVVRRLRVTASDFTFEGERLRVVRATHWAALRSQDDGRYQVVPSGTARARLQKLADWPAISVDERAALADAVALVPEPRQAAITDGVLLLRMVPRSATLDRARRDPPVTPSQLARQEQAKRLWVQIELVDAAGRPVPNERYTLELPDGEIRDGTLDAAGRAYVGDIKVGGQCRVSFPEIDASEWRPA